MVLELPGFVSSWRTVGTFINQSYFLTKLNLSTSSFPRILQYFSQSSVLYKLIQIDGWCLAAEICLTLEHWSGHLFELSIMIIAITQRCYCKLFLQVHSKFGQKKKKKVHSKSFSQLYPPCLIMGFFCSYLRRGLGWHFPEVVGFELFTSLVMAFTSWQLFAACQRPSSWLCLGSSLVRLRGQWKLRAIG